MNRMHARASWAKFLLVAETTILPKLHDYSFRKNGHYLIITILLANAKALQEMFDAICRLQKRP